MNLKNFNTAESITLVRIFGFPLILLLIYLNERNLTAWSYIILFSTDFIDGFFAFFYNQESERRAKLDTLGDILLLFSGLLGFFVFEKEFFLRYVVPISIVLGLYFLQLILALIKWKQPSSFHTYSAKLAAIAQVIFLSLTLIFEASTGLFYLAVTLSVLDVTEDIILTLILPKWQANIKGLLWYQKDKKATTNETTG